MYMNKSNAWSHNLKKVALAHRKPTEKGIYIVGGKKTVIE